MGVDRHWAEARQCCIDAGDVIGMGVRHEHGDWFELLLLDPIEHGLWVKAAIDDPALGVFADGYNKAVGLVVAEGKGVDDRSRLCHGCMLARIGVDPGVSFIYWSG